MIEMPVTWTILNVGNVGIPFMIAGMTASKVNSTRMMEAAIIAIISSLIMAAFGYFVAFPVLQEQVRQIRTDISDVKSGQKEAISRIELYQLERRTLRDQQQQQADSRIRQLEIELAKRK